MFESLHAGAVNPYPEQSTAEGPLSGVVSASAPLLVKPSVKFIIDILAAIEAMKVVVIFGVNHLNPSGILAEHNRSESIE